MDDHEYTRLDTTEDLSTEDEVGDPSLPNVLRRLEKGGAVPVHEVERLFQVSRDTEQYRLVALRLRSQVEHEFAHRDPAQIVCVRIDSRAGVVVLTDDESVEHTNRGQARHVRGVRRTHRKRLGIDRGKVGAENQPLLDRAIEVAGRIIAAVGRELRRKPVPPAARPRSKPSK